MSTMTCSFVLPSKDNSTQHAYMINSNYIQIEHIEGFNNVSIEEKNEDIYITYNT